MTEPAEKSPKRIKDYKPTPEQRQANMRYNQMMYGPTEGELKHAPRKVDFGASYLKHPKFQSLMTAFRRGASFKFDITAGGALSCIATDGTHITFNDKVIYYTRPLNKHVDNLFLDRASAVQLQGNDAVVHLVFAVLRSFPELGEPQLAYQYHKLYQGNESLETGPTGPGSNLLIGGFKHSKPLERPKS
jgi:hypothetical protein